MKSSYERSANDASSFGMKALHAGTRTKGRRAAMTALTMNEKLK
jgi:hypothetical protein